MSKFNNPLNNLRIASPCSADWNQMIGDDRQRHCAECKLNVYNLSGMTRREAEDLILNSEGRICMRIYRRADGTDLTKDCPVGWSAVKQRISKVATAFASIIFALLGGIGLTSYFSSSDDSKTMGVVAATEHIPPVIEDDYTKMGEIEPLMGNIAIPEEDIPEFEMGKIASNTSQLNLGEPNIKDLKRQIEKKRNH